MMGLDGFDGANRASYTLVDDCKLVGRRLQLVDDCKEISEEGEGENNEDDAGENERIATEDLSDGEIGSNSVNNMIILSHFLFFFLPLLFPHFLSPQLYF